MASSKSDSQRKDALSYLTNTITAAQGAELPQPVAVILPKVQPLILDGSKGIREQLLKLFRALPAAEVANHADQILLYIRAGMTHLAVDIRSSSLDVLDWLVRTCGPEVVSCAGGWVKTLSCFMALLGWRTTEQNGKWSSTRASFSKKGTETKLLVKQLDVLKLFLETGLRSPPLSNADAQYAARLFPLCQVELHRLPRNSNPFGHLNLFGAPRDAESEMYDDPEGRREIFGELMYEPTKAGTLVCKKEGGEVGRAARQLEKVLVQCMKDHEEDADSDSS